MNNASRFDELLDQLKDKLARPGSSLLPVLGLMSRLAHYSLHNQLLIFMQRPNATRVMGFHAWRQAGYQVRKGEKGIAIYAPMRFTVQDPKEDQHLFQGCYGYTNGKRITCAIGLPANIEFGTLVHETAHALLHFGADRPDLTVRETEAEAITYLLSEQLGLEDTQLAIDYIRSYRGTPDLLDASLQRIRTTAARLMNELNAFEFDYPEEGVL